jgi:hypothetical protein
VTTVPRSSSVTYIVPRLWSSDIDVGRYIVQPLTMTLVPPGISKRLMDAPVGGNGGAGAKRRSPPHWRQRLPLQREKLELDAPECSKVQLI